MYYDSLIKLYDYLDTLVISDENQGEFDAGGVALPQSSLPLGYYFKDRLLYRGPAELFDKYGVFDPLERRVEGDHYATSHFVLFSAAMYKLTGDEKYLQSCKNSGEFCLRCLNGYPHVPWDMHYDFNNYALALACYILGEALPSVVRERWIRYLGSATQNKHRVGNWFGQRLLFYALHKRNSGSLSFVHKFKMVIDQYLWRRCFADDGAMEDHPGKSRPIQYHAFNLALFLLLEGLGEWRTASPIAGSGIDYLVKFIAPDGDFNFYGRGHKQIFGYSPALFVFEVAASQRPELRSCAERVWNFVKDQQRAEGDFPLVLSPSPSTSRLGWYDYHRHTVYNAFFGAWLALAELQHRNMPITDCSGIGLKTNENVIAGQGNIFVAETSSYYICLSRTYAGYTSECGGTPHKLYAKGGGNVISCPGGPSPTPGGFGTRFVFESLHVNYFFPLWKYGGEWGAPISERSFFCVENGQVRYGNLSWGIDFFRCYVFEENVIRVRDEIVVKSNDISRLRLVNIPINVSEMGMKIQGNNICLSSASSNETVCGINVECDCSFSVSEKYQWVDGLIHIVAGEIVPGQSTYVVNYQFDFNVPRCREK